MVFLIERGFIVEANEFEKRLTVICTARDNIAESSESGNLLTAQEIITYLKKILSLFESLNDVSQDLPLIVTALELQMYLKDQSKPSVSVIRNQIEEELKNLHKKFKNLDKKYKSDILSAQNELQMYQTDLNALVESSGELSQGGGTTAEIESSAKEQVDSSYNKAQEDLIKAVNLLEDRLDLIQQTYAQSEQVLIQHSACLDKLNIDNQSAYREVLIIALDVLMRADTKKSSFKLPFWSSKKTSILGDLLLTCNESECVELLLSVHKLDVFFKNSSPTAYLRDLMLNIPRDQLGVVIAESDQRNASQSSCSSSDAAEASSPSNESGVYQIILSAFDKEIVKLNSSHKETLDSYEDCLKAIQASARQRDFYRVTRNLKSISRQQALEFRDAFCGEIDELLGKIAAARQLAMPEQPPEIETSGDTGASNGQPSVSSQHAGRWASIPSNIMRVMLSNEVLTVVGLGVLYTVVDAIPAELPIIPSFKAIFATGSDITAIDDAYNHSIPVGMCMGVFD